LNCVNQTRWKIRTNRWRFQVDNDDTNGINGMKFQTGTVTFMTGIFGLHLWNITDKNFTDRLKFRVTTQNFVFSKLGNSKKSYRANTLLYFIFSLFIIYGSQNIRMRIISWAHCKSICDFIWTISIC
jgi:hypothetical protein